MINKILAAAINAMAVQDQKIRHNANQVGVWDSDINFLDNQNTTKLKIIIKQYGWPTISMVGKRASFNAWLLVQHADHDLRFQKRVLKILENIYKKNTKDIDPANIAFLMDRICVAEKRKQLFGTQFYCNKKGVFSPRPIANIKNIENRRKKYNMRPFAEDIIAAKKFKPLQEKCKTSDK